MSFVVLFLVAMSLCYVTESVSCVRHLGIDSKDQGQLQKYYLSNFSILYSIMFSTVIGQFIRADQSYRRLRSRFDRLK